MKGRSCGLFLCLFLGIACFSGYQVLRILHEYLSLIHISEPTRPY